MRAWLATGITLFRSATWNWVSLRRRSRNTKGISPSTRRAADRASAARNAAADTAAEAGTTAMAQITTKETTDAIIIVVGAEAEAEAGEVTVVAITNPILSS